ncbi:MAG: glycosyltransferase family 2 protein [Planctomycetota bacterium]
MTEQDLSSASGSVDLSVIVPVFNERENLAPLVDEIRAALDSMPGVTAEVLMIDDGSSDGSADVLRDLAAAHPALVRVLTMSRNYGQTAALDAGIRRAVGRVIVPMDADRQNDPADIPRLLAEVARGADVASGWRKRRQDAFINRRLPSQIANWIISRLTGVKIHDFGCTLKAYRRDVLAGVRLYGEMHRFIPAYALWQGGRVVEVVVNHRPRTWGKSKYGIRRTFRVLMDLMTVMFLQGRYASKPLHLFGRVGALIFGLALALAIYVAVQKAWYPVDDVRHVFVHRNPLFVLSAMAAMMGLGAIALGLLAELLSRIYHVTAGTPYSIAGGRNVPGLPTPEEARALSPALAKLAEAHGKSPDVETVRMSGEPDGRA